MLQTSTPRILIVEDDISQQFLITEFLKMRGYLVVTASNGIEAIDRLEEQSFDLILMDRRMPILDGHETAQRVRKHINPRVRSIPIIGLTASVPDRGYQKFFNSRVDDLLNKPFDLFELDALLKKWLKCIPTYSN
jgi:CheY-like chemotaxis protein